jgi:short-subunit dehydrogenase
MPDQRHLAFITGASSGLGATFARQLAHAGYDLVLVARRADRLEALATELRATHPIAVETVQADLERDEDVVRVSGLLSCAARLTLLVNNAGFGTKGYFWQTDADRQDAMHRLHVLATERLTRAALPGMVERRRGGIINVASVAGFLQSAGNISYCATKAWMIRFTEGLWMELHSAGSPVVVQALCPGFTYTEFHDVMQVPRGEFGPAWWMSAEFVVAESIRALQQRKLIVIPGWRYRWLVWLVNAAPQGLIRRATSRVRKPRV